MDLDIAPGATVGLIGESGSGKSVMAQSIMRIVPYPGVIVSGSIVAVTSAHGTIDLARLDPRGRTIRDIRGKDIAMVFQEPMTSLSPVHTIGDQIGEAIKLHRPSDADRVHEVTLEMLAKVGISNPAQRINEYPFQFSGGMRQRVMIAMALSCDPRVLVADEPTTALDVTVQAQILELIAGLQRSTGMSVLYITHDLGVIAEIADVVNVMYLGRVVERASVIPLFEQPRHPYTQGLLKSIPDLERTGRRRLNPIQGNVPVPLDPPVRCGFYGRCPVAIEGRCDVAQPALVTDAEGHGVRCFRVNDQVEVVSDE